MKISEVLRTVAFLLPANGRCTFTAALGGKTDETSPYICDCLDTNPAFDNLEIETLAAKNYLIALGMGTGFCVFDPESERRVDKPASRKTQYLRCTWLLFAADLWDEGFYP